VLAGGEQDDATTCSGVIVRGRELAHQEQRRADVLVQEGIDLVRRDVGEAPVPLRA
jgi:hypothetical protein